MDTHTLKEKGLLGIVILLVAIVVLLVLNFFFTSSGLEQQAEETGTLFENTSEEERYALDGRIVSKDEDGLTLLIDGEEHSVSPVPELYQYANGEYYRVGLPFLYPNITASVWFVIPSEGDSYVERIVVFT